MGPAPKRDEQDWSSDLGEVRERLARLELYAKDSRVAILRVGTRLPVSRAGYARLKELL